MRSANSVVSCASLLFFFASANACGGAVAGVDDGGAGAESDGGAVGEGGRSKGGDGSVAFADAEVLGAACPLNAPIDGASCATADLTCEYGGVGTHLRCSTVFSCIAAGNEAARWIARRPPPDCVGSQADNAPTCPGSFGALPTGSACPANTGWACVYPEGLCECSPCASADGGGSQDLWSCKEWPVPVPPCPSPRPRIGSACTVENQGCYYGSLCSSVGFDQPAMVCRKGVWHDDPLPQPPCAFPFCGQ